MSFLSEFFDIPDEAGEQQVCCPFPHHTSNSGLEYFETHPSAHVNTTKHLFHCKACNVGLNEEQFIEKVLQCSHVDAIKILKSFDNAEDAYIWNETQRLTDKGRELAHSFNISDQVISELHITSPESETHAQAPTTSLNFPCMVYNKILDVRTYAPGCKPKVRSRAGAPTGLIIPYDLWHTSPKKRVTVICAGEKDMAVARSHGLNAITITGGERSLPKFMSDFKDRIIAICYDNDDTGRAGAEALALELLKVTPHVKVVTGFHRVCKEEKEDITDFFNKYNQTKNDLVNFIKEAPFFTPALITTENTSETKDAPIMDLYTATLPINRNKVVRSNIQVIAVTDTTYTMPTSVMFEKHGEFGNDVFHKGTTITWDFDVAHLADLLHVVDNNFNEDQIKDNLKKIVKIPTKEKGMSMRILDTKTIFKAHVTDMFETNVENAVPMEFQAYSVNHRLESGKKYLVTYKLVPHPYKGNQLMMIIFDVIDANDSVSNFTITDTAKAHLKQFQDLSGTVPQRIDLLTEKVKGLTGYNGNNTLIQAIDLSYHTALEFNLGSFKNVRGYLDTLIVGESRTGKSSTANTLRQHYKLGIFTSLAGNSATIPGLIGGSNKTASGFQTRAGVIPQNHRGLIIFEELGKCKQDIISELTDIRSSNEVRIARVSGTITLPALVRMIALTNVKNTGSGIKPIATYPNGIEVVTELVGTAEDIARYDLLVVLSDRGTSQIDPFWEPQPPMPDEVYQTRIRWIWSRTAEQIQISKEVGLYILERSNALNKDFDCHIKIFGTEAWKKLSRLAIAVAGYLVSTDDSYENIIVTKEHVDYAESFFRQIYDNDTFRLREYVTNERLYSTIDIDGLSLLQDLYTKYPALLFQLEKTAGTTKNTLGSASGLSQDDLNKALSRLTRGLFIQYSGYEIIPTERFRIGMKKLNRSTVVERLGEHHA